MPPLAQAFTNILHSQKLVQPLFIAVQPSLVLQQQVRKSLVDLVVPARSNPRSAQLDGALRYAVDQGLQKAWPHALAATAATAGGKKRGATAFVKALVAHGVGPAVDAFNQKIREPEAAPSRVDARSTNPLDRLDAPRTKR